MFQFLQFFITVPYLFDCMFGFHLNHAFFFFFCSWE